ncbi:MAG: bifunctional glutamate N-acetyltransferase/amino-acid acetyltransferase ArgJ [Desulfobulbaceae bacterium]|uniref:Arginine biosynthesis bifunctional protein ArgJ n=1 Tax=Candidatus Desulfobia pelagia TaxID=2841692 RepID=A0A8J6TBP8_9BACT|nr:bifunctional glutamate N-acetyltransferase/amino-acid acetyltransferase ArgJ [Candidatus Desulfobia pelagia]
MTAIHVPGFKAGAVKAGIRGKDRLDVGLIYSEVPATAAGVFTTSLVKAAPVLLGIKHLEGGKAQAIIVNSGIANACTGEEGMELALTTASLVADYLDIDSSLVQVSSTGVIGMQLDIGIFENCMGRLVDALADDGLTDVSLAMMTTDTVPKTARRTLTIDGKEIALVGLAKGSGMIMPNMATMLSYVMTDASVASDVLSAMLQKSVSQSFNAITVDGDTSTNDTVLLLANGVAGNSQLTSLDSADAVLFQQCLDSLLLDLALQIVKDGEGATKLITVHVTGARTIEDADRAARTIANSSLFKTACFGEDANWGRIIAALGRSGAAFDAYDVRIAFDDVVMVEKGLGLSAEQEVLATAVLKKDAFVLSVDIGAGSSESKVHTCDLSIDYIKINADYRS